MPETADEVIRIRAVFDGSQLRSGLATSVKDVSASTDQISGSFKKVGEESSAGMSIAANDAAKLTSAVDKANQHLGEAGELTNKEFTEAARNIRGLGEEIGVHLPREVSKYIASLGGIAPIAAAAFSIVGIIGIVEAIPEVINKINDVVDAMAGWDSFAEALYKKLIKDNADLVVSNVKLKESYREISLIGEYGQKKLSDQNKDLLTERQDATNATKQFAHSIESVQKENEELSTGARGVWTGLVGWIDGTDKKIKEGKENIVLFREEMDKLQDLSKTIDLKIATNKGQSKADAITEFREIATARVEAEKQATTSIASLDVALARQQYEEGNITIDEEIEAFKNAENQKYAALVQFYEKKKALDKSNPNAVEGATSYIRDDAEENAAAKQHQAELTGIEETGGREKLQIQKQIGEAQINAEKSLADARIAVDESAARELYDSKKIESSQLTQVLLNEENKRVEAERKAIQGRLALAQQDAQKNQAEIITLNGELETLQVNHEARMNQIKAQGDRQQLADIKQTMEQELRQSEDTANRLLQMAEADNEYTLKTHGETSRQWLAIEKAAIEEWYNSQATTLRKELDVAKQTFGEQSIEYKNLINKMNQLDLQRERMLQQATLKEQQMVLQAYSQMFSGFNGAIAKMMNGQESFAKSFEQSWNQMVTTMAMNLAKGVEQWAISLLLHESFAEKSVLVSAKSAAAKAWESAPNPIVGAVEAAATFAAVMAYGSFDRGGVVPNDGFHQLHKKEMVLPAGISTGLTKAINSGEIGGSQGGSPQSNSIQSNQENHNHLHLDYRPQVNAYDRHGMSATLQSHGDDIVAIVQGGLKAGKFKP